MVVAWFLGTIGEQQLHRLSSNAFTRKDFIDAEVEAWKGGSLAVWWMAGRECQCPQQIGCIWEKKGEVLQNNETM